MLYDWMFKMMGSTVFDVCRLVFGTLYPAYKSYKAVRTKNVKEYVSRTVCQCETQA